MSGEARIGPPPPAPAMANGIWASIALLTALGLGFVMGVESGAERACNATGRDLELEVLPRNGSICEFAVPEAGPHEAITAAGDLYEDLLVREANAAAER